jgi:hypothetical protein
MVFKHQSQKFRHNFFLIYVAKIVKNTYVQKFYYCQEQIFDLFFIFPDTEAQPTSNSNSPVSKFKAEKTA